jgi:hypothetical protein
MSSLALQVKTGLDILIISDSIVEMGRKDKI